MRSVFGVLTLLVLTLGGSRPAWPQGAARDVTVEGMRGEKRVALVIGNAAYPSSPLRNPVNDAREIARALSALGFEVLEFENLGQRDMRRAVIEFGNRLRHSDVGLFYFAGHGMQVGGRNYLVPIDASPQSEDEVEVESVDVAAVLARMSTARNRLNVVILDACRDNPFGRSFRSSTRGLASIDAPTGTIIAYATAPGKVARDGDGKNGLYTAELLQVIKVPGLKVEDTFKRVRQAVQRKSGGDQVPWESSSLVGDFLFALPAAGPPVAAAPPVPVPQPPVAAPPRVAALPPGGVRIESPPPGAEVYWSARPVGKTPVALEGVAPGRYQLVLVREGYSTVIEDVHVTPGQPLTIAKRLDEQTVSQEVVARPGGASIDARPRVLDRKLRPNGLSRQASRMTRRSFFAGSIACKTRSSATASS